MARTKTSTATRTRRAATAAGIALAVAGAPAAAAASDTKAVLAANAGFYAALNKTFAGDMTDMKTVWSHADDVGFMGPNGHIDHGWANVLKVWKAHTASKLGGKVTPTGIYAIVGRDLAVVTDTEDGKNTNANGKVERVKLRATNTFRKEGGQWKMVGHHTDLLPFLNR